MRQDDVDLIHDEQAFGRIGYADRAVVNEAQLHGLRPTGFRPLRCAFADNAEIIAAVCGLIILAVYNIANWNL